MSDDSDVTLSDFDDDIDNMLDFTKPKIVLLNGQCGVGKTKALKWIILKHTVDIPIWEFGIAFTGTKFDNDLDFLPDEYVFQGYDESILARYIDQLTKRKEDGEDIPHNFLVFDDLHGIINNLSPLLKNLVTIHRHLNMTIIFSNQVLKSRNTTLREIVNYGIFFNTKRKDTIKAIFEEFGQLFDNFKEFKEFFLNATKEKYTAIFYDSSIDELEDNYMIFKAPLIENDVKLEF